MAKQLEVYKCSLCGNIVEVLHGGVGELVCCGQPMQLLTENTVDAAKEKHVPVIEIGAGSITVKVGSVARITSYNVCYTKLLRYRFRVFPARSARPEFPRNPLWKSARS